MSAFFTALGSFGESYGKAGELRAENERANQELELRKQESQRQQEASERQKTLQELAKKKYENDLIDIGLPPYTENGAVVKQMWSPAQGKVVPVRGAQTGEVTGLEALRKLIAEQDPQDSKELQSVANAELQIDPSDTKGALKAVLSRAEKLKDQRSIEKRELDKRNSESNLERNASTGTYWRIHKDNTKEDTGVRYPKTESENSGDTRSVADKAKDIQSGSATLKDFPTKERGAIATYMRENKMDAKRVLNPTEKRTLDIMNQIEPKVSQLKKLIEETNLTDSNDWVFGNRSSMMQHLRMMEYKAGASPDKLGADLIRASAALSVMGAGPWMALGRGKYMFETIQQHLPSPTDTPKLLYDKVQFLQSIVDEAKDSLGQPDSSTGMPSVNISPTGEITIH